MPKKAKLGRAPTYVKRLRMRWKADLVERRRVAKAKKLSRPIHPHLRHRSHTAIAGNSTVCEQCPFSRSTFRRSFSECSHSCRFRACPNGSSTQQERIEHRRQGQIEPEVYRVCHGQTIPPWGQRLCRCLRPPQICGRGSLLYPRKLRGITLVSRVPPATLTDFLAHEGK